MRVDRRRQVMTGTDAGDERLNQVISILRSGRLRHRLGIAGINAAKAFASGPPAAVLQDLVAAAGGCFHEITAAGGQAIRRVSGGYRPWQRELLEEKRQE